VSFTLVAGLSRVARPASEAPITPGGNSPLKSAHQSALGTVHLGERGAGCLGAPALARLTRPCRSSTACTVLFAADGRRQSGA
jgi:hypothetical protein